MGTGAETGMPLLGKEVTQLTDSEFIPGQLYTYTLVAIAGDNQSNPVQTQITPVLLSSLTTKDISGLRITTAIGGGDITNDGGAPITARGVCWSTSANPTVNNNKTNDGSGIGTFTSTITGLAANTTYYLRAYSTNSAGTSYGNEIMFKTFFGEVSDADGNVYLTVKIGEQVWMAENLKTTKYNDGTSIPNVTDGNTWKSLTAGAYCWFDNDSINYKNKYGGLFNWYSINSGKLAPVGWRVATNDDWKKLEIQLGMSLLEANVLGGWRGTDQGKQMKTTNGWFSNSGTNTSGFSAVPGGFRHVDGRYLNFGTFGYWWTATESSTLYAIYRHLNHANHNVANYEDNKGNGFSVRCILGDPILPNITTPTVTTSSVSDFTSDSAVLGGNVTNDGNAAVTERGVVYGTTQNPTTANTKIAIGSGTGSFNSTVSGLTSNTTYYVRAYANNSMGTSYGTQVNFVTLNNNDNNTGHFTDPRDGNAYKWVKIGKQIWMAENLKYIPSVSPPDKGSTIEPICYVYDYFGIIVEEAKNTSNYNKYGVLYNWPAVMQGSPKSYLNPSGVRGICPEGWHVPSHLEWEELNTFLSPGAGGKMKSTDGWEPPNTGATNTSGFSGLPGGRRYSVDNSFKDIGLSGTWHSTNEQYTEGMSQEWNTSSNFSLSSYSSSFHMNGSSTLSQGYSIRCIKD